MIHSRSVFHLSFSDPFMQPRRSVNRGASPSIVALTFTVLCLTSARYPSAHVLAFLYLLIASLSTMHASLKSFQSDLCTRLCEHSHVQVLETVIADSERHAVEPTFSEVDPKASRR